MLQTRESETDPERILPARRKISAVTKNFVWGIKSSQLFNYLQIFGQKYNKKSTNPEKAAVSKK